MTTTTTDSIADIVAFARARGAWCEALAWLKRQPDAATAWQTCERPDWLIWWLKRQPATDRKTLIRIACACARTALRFVPEGEERPLFAIETTERWLVGGATIEEVRTAAHADAAVAIGAGRAAPTRAAAHAAYAAADYAADYAADADAADYAVHAAAHAADAAAADVDAARRQANIQMCGIIRRHVGMDGGAL